MYELNTEQCEQVAGGVFLRPVEGEELARRLPELLQSVWRPAIVIPDDWM